MAVVQLPDKWDQNFRAFTCRRSDPEGQEPIVSLCKIDLVLPEVRIGSESCEAEVFKLSIDNKDYALKVMPASTPVEIAKNIKEIDYAKAASDAVFRGESPYFAKVYDAEFCNTIRHSNNESKLLPVERSVQEPCSQPEGVQGPLASFPGHLLVSELASGDLKQWIALDTTDEEGIRALLLHMIKALLYLHGTLGIVHNDLHLGNVLIINDVNCGIIPVIHDYGNSVPLKVRVDMTDLRSVGTNLFTDFSMFFSNIDLATGPRVRDLTRKLMDIVKRYASDSVYWYFPNIEPMYQELFDMIRDHVFVDLTPELSEADRLEIEAEIAEVDPRVRTIMRRKLTAAKLAR